VRGSTCEARADAVAEDDVAVEVVAVVFEVHS
jgi:hypothetical protein